MDSIVDKSSLKRFSAALILLAIVDPNVKTGFEQIYYVLTDLFVFIRVFFL